MISISATGLAGRETLFRFCQLCETGKWQGSVVGEFLLERSGESYRQRHTVTWGQPSFLFRQVEPFKRKRHFENVLLSGRKVGGLWAKAREMMVVFELES